MTITLLGPDSGGISHVARSIAQHWPASSTPLQAILVDDQGHVTVSSCGCSVSARPTSTSQSRRSVASAAIRSAWQHRRCLRTSGSFHLELGRVSVAAFWFTVAASLLNRRAPLVTASHDIPTVVLHPGAAVIVQAPGWRDILAYRLLAPVLDAALVRRLRRRTSATVVLSRAAAETAEQLRWPCVTPVDHGAEPKTEPAVDPGDADYVLLIGYLGPGKGLDVLASAWEVADHSLPLVIAGGHSAQHAAWVAAVRERFDQSERPPTWLGYVSDEEFSRLVRDSAVVVLPYEDSNPASGVLIRALVEGRAVVASAVPAVTDEVEDGANGLVVPASDPVALGQALTRLTTSAELRDRLGAVAAHRASIRHSWTTHCAALAALHAELVATPRAPEPEEPATIAEPRPAEIGGGA